MTDAPAGHIGLTYRDSEPAWPETPSAVGRPNVVFIVLDDMGYASLGCYGSEIETPNIDRLAADGIRFTNFHATALCSPTRASLLTGRNSHAVGMAYLSNVDDGYPGYRGRITHRAATLAEILVDHGYNTTAIGKWHLTPMDQTTAAGPYDQWPLGRGFERYYGFLEGLTDHYYPELFEDNHPVPPPASPDDGYHLSEDLVTRALAQVRDQTAVVPERPFFCYLAFGATHTPFQAPADYVAKYRHVYDEGWDVIRERRFQRQLEMGLIPPDTELAPPNDGVPAWDELSPEARDLYARFQEVYAGFLDHTDAQIGRFLDGLRDLGRLDDTIVVFVSDNGASQEGGPHGVVDTTAYENGHFTTFEHNLERIDQIDGRTTHVNYPLGWAQAANAPLKRYKQNTHAGGIRTSMIVRMPGGEHAGEFRDAFHHVTDIVPTVLDLIGIEAPVERRGIEQLPLDGVSMVDTITAPATADRRRTQYFETDGHRAIWADGWKAVAFHPRGEPFENDQWELYHVDEDFSECHDLAATHPDKLAEMIELWWDQARRNQVLPLDDRGFAERANARFRPDSPRARKRFRYLPGMTHIGNSAAPPVAGRSHRIVVDIERAADDNGVLVAHGNVCTGYCLHVDQGHLVYDYNYYDDHEIVRSSTPVPTGRSTVAVDFTLDDPDDPTVTSATVTLSIDGEEVATMHLDESFEHFVSWQGVDIGRDGLSPVRADGDGAAPFAGSIVDVVIELLDGDRRAYEPRD